MKKTTKSSDAVVSSAPNRFRLTPRNENQREFLSQIQENDLTFGIGPAGTGKTHCAVASAVQQYLNHQVKHIVLVRPAVEAGEKLGYLPGTVQEKVDPYFRPIYDSLNKTLGALKVQTLMAEGVIEIAPLAFMRGRTFEDSFIVLDEAQNTTVEQMKMFLTRMGCGSRMVVNGDRTQIDLPKREKSGLVDALELILGIKGVGIVEFDAGDVVRHKLVQRIVDAYKAGDEPVATE